MPPNPTRPNHLPCLEIKKNATIKKTILSVTDPLRHAMEPIAYDIKQAPKRPFRVYGAINGMEEPTRLKGGQ